MLGARPGKKATIYDIAQASQASPATVSMVLTGKWQAQRISSETANRILAAAEAVDYRANLRARSLRLSRSGLIGMIIPHYRNRFFAGLAENFEKQARDRGLCPIVVSTQRAPQIEDSVVSTLLAQQVEALFVAGVKRPERLNSLCIEAGVPVIDIDLPGKNAPSVVSNNREGARMLTEEILNRAENFTSKTAGPFYSIGGDASDHATAERIVGFRQALKAHKIGVSRIHVRSCGFSPAESAHALQDMLSLHDKDPAGVFVNSITALEGVAMTIRSLGVENFSRTAIGCNDWDPFGSMLPMRIVMARQNVEQLIEEGFKQLDVYTIGECPLISVMPEFPDHRSAV